MTFATGAGGHPSLARRLRLDCRWFSPAHAPKRCCPTSTQRRYAEPGRGIAAVKMVLPVAAEVGVACERELRRPAQRCGQFRHSDVRHPRRARPHPDQRSELWRFVPGDQLVENPGSPNNIVVGVSIDRGPVQFNAASELATIDQNLFVNGAGVIINQDELAPVSLLTNTTYTGLVRDRYLRDHAAARAHRGRTLQHRPDHARRSAQELALKRQPFPRFNPVVGATRKLLLNTTSMLAIQKQTARRHRSS